MCRYDYLKIGNENNRTIGTYCGNQTGQSVLVTGHYAVISFYSDGSVQYSGYELFFNHVPGKCHDSVEMLFTLIMSQSR